MNRDDTAVDMARTFAVAQAPAVSGVCQAIADAIRAGAIAGVRAAVRGKLAPARSLPERGQ